MSQTNNPEVIIIDPELDRALHKQLDRLEDAAMNCSNSGKDESFNLMKDINAQICFLADRIRANRYVSDGEYKGYRR